MRKYFLSFLLAFTLHLSIIALFIFNATDKPSHPKKQKLAPETIITATILDETLVVAKANELKQQQESKKRLQQKKKDDYARQLKQQKQQLKKIKEQHIQAEKSAKKQAEQRKIAALQEQKKHAEAVRKRQAEEKKRVLENKRKAEAERVAEENRKVERAKKEAARKEVVKQQKIAADKRQKEMQESLQLAAAEEAEQDRQRVANARITSKAASNAAVLIKRKITQNWNRPGSVPKNLKCKIKIELLPGGDVMKVVIIKSSGNSLFDESTERAVRKASPLPVPKDPMVFKKFRSFNLVFDPDKK